MHFSSKSTQIGCALYAC